MQRKQAHLATILRINDCSFKQTSYDDNCTIVRITECAPLPLIRELSKGLTFPWGVHAGSLLVTGRYLVDVHGKADKGSGSSLILD
jgi:hypothetical protein